MSQIDIPHVSQIQNFIEFWLGSSFFDEGRLQASYEIGSGDSRLIIVTGENATGKSIFGRVLQEGCHWNNSKIECIKISMAFRTRGGIESSFVFGDENKFSTGAISIGTVLSGVTTSRNRKKQHFMIWDEPDIGLSPGYQAAVGQYFTQYVSNLPELTVGVAIMTHSQRLLQPLVALHPHHIRMGGDGLLLNQVAFGEIADQSIENLETLQKRSIELLQSLQNLFH